MTPATTRSTTIGELAVGDVIVTEAPYSKTLRVEAIVEFDRFRDVTMVDTILLATFGPILYPKDKIVDVAVPPTVSG